MKAKINLFGKSYMVDVKTNKYQNGGLAVQLFDSETHETFATISVNLPESQDIPKDAFYVKHWSENEPIIAQLIQQNIIELAKDCEPASSGFVSGIYAYRLVGKNTNN
jgi:hypothetical protein